MLRWRKKNQPPYMTHTNPRTGSRRAGPRLRQRRATSGPEKNKMLIRSTPLHNPWGPGRGGAGGGALLVPVRAQLYNATASDGVGGEIFPKTNLNPSSIREVQTGIPISNSDIIPISEFRNLKSSACPVPLRQKRPGFNPQT